MRFSIRTLLIVVLLGGPLLAGAYYGLEEAAGLMMWALAIAGIVTAAAWLIPHLRRFSLRTLIIATAIAPPALAGLWWTSRWLNIPLVPLLLVSIAAAELYFLTVWMVYQFLTILDW